MARLLTGPPPTGGASTIVVAASGASARVKTQADYVCDGTADEVEINAAIAALPTPYVGSVVLSEGLFTTAAPIVGYRDGLTIRGAGAGHPTGGASAAYATTPVTSGTLIRPASTFAGDFVIDCRVTGNIITSLNGALVGGETTIPLTSVTGLPTAGTVYVYGKNQGSGVAVAYTGISGSSLTGATGTGTLVADDLARVNYGARTLAGVTLEGFSVDGFGAGAPFIDASGILFQAFRSYMRNVKVVRFKRDGIVVDGSGTAAVSPLGGFDNRFDSVYVEKCGIDAVKQVGGASDNIWTAPIIYGGHATLGRYGMYLEASPGTIINGGHFAVLNDTAILGNARQLKIGGGTRFTDCAKGGVYLTGVAAQGQGFSIAASFRDMATGNANSYDAINIAPTAAIRGGLIDDCEFNNYADANAVRYLVNIANSNANDVTIGSLGIGYTTPATKAFATAAINDAGTNTMRTVAAKLGTDLTDIVIPDSSQLLGFKSIPRFKIRSGDATNVVDTNRVTAGLDFAVLANERWYAEYVLAFAGSNTTDDVQLKFAFPTGTTILWGTSSASGNTLIPFAGVSAATTPAALAVETSNPTFGSFAGTFSVSVSAFVDVSSTAGTIDLQYANNAGTGPLTLKKQSIAKLWRLA